MNFPGITMERLELGADILSQLLTKGRKLDGSGYSEIALRIVRDPGSHIKFAEIQSPVGTYKQIVKEGESWLVVINDLLRAHP